MVFCGAMIVLTNRQMTGRCTRDSLDKLHSATTSGRALAYITPARARTPARATISHIRAHDYFAQSRAIITGPLLYTVELAVWENLAFHCTLQRHLELRELPRSMALYNATRKPGSCQ